MAAVFTHTVAPTLFFSNTPPCVSLDFIKQPGGGLTPPPGTLFLTNDTGLIDLTADDGTTLLLTD